MTKRAIVAAGLIAVGCAALVWTVRPRGSSVPAPAGPGFVHQGRTIQDWVNSVSMANKDQNPEIQSVVAIGAPAVPYLVQRLQDRSSSLTRSPLYRAAWFALPGRLQRSLRPPADPRQVEQQKISSVAYTLGLIGPEAKVAVPVLTQVAGDRRLRNNTRLFAVQALGQIGPSAQSAVPVLVSCLKDDHKRLRRECGRYDDIGNVDRKTRDQYADREDLELRTVAAGALGRIGVPEPRAREPLTLLLGATNARAKCSAAVALWRMDGCQSNRDVVFGLLQSSNLALRRSTTLSLGHIGEPAACFVPVLRTMLDETNDLRHTAEFALSRIQISSSTNQ